MTIWFHSEVLLRCCFSACCKCLQNKFETLRATWIEICPCVHGNRSLCLALHSPASPYSILYHAPISAKAFRQARLSPYCVVDTGFSSVLSNACRCRLLIKCHSIALSQH